MERNGTSGTGPVTRAEIVGHLEDAFATGGSAAKDELLIAAITSGARPGVIAALHLLPAGRYQHARDLWRHLPDVPIDG